MAPYRKKPVVIEAFQFTGESNLNPAVPGWFVDAILEKKVVAFPEHIEIHTLEGVLRAYRTDWIIRGVKGELYPCKPEIFDETYEAVAAPAPVDRNQRTLTDGSPVTADHRDLLPSGQQKGYVVLSADERAKGFVRPVRRTYVHKKCGVATTMGSALAETYARDPSFYSGTFCVGCRTHFRFDQPDGDFTWDDGSKVGE